jgi:hypothetical protein
MVWSDLFVIDRVDGFGFGVFVHEVDFGPVVSSLRVAAWLVLLKSFPALLLLVSLDFAKIAELSVSIAVVSIARIYSSPGS